jgi:intracellular septation protein A
MNKKFLQFIILPLIFLAVTLFGGLRLSFDANAFLFLKPQLICLILSAILFVLFVRARLIKINEFFAEDFSLPKNICNALILLTLFTATTQVFNSLLPEKSIAFWIIAFCFLWSLWTNLFAELSSKKLLISLASLFGLEFVVKYFVLASLVSSNETTWTQKIFSELSAGLLDLPKFSSATGYIQFFTLILYLAGIYLIDFTGIKTEINRRDTETQS